MTEDEQALPEGAIATVSSCFTAVHLCPFPQSSFFLIMKVEEATTHSGFGARQALPLTSYETSDRALTLSGCVFSSVEFG